VLAILVGATMWLQQKMSTATSADPGQAQQAKMMLWMMPMMFTFLALSFPSGLSLYWVVNSIVRILMQYRVTGWGGLRGTRAPEGEKDKKYLKFEASPERKSTDDVGADIVISDSDSSKSLQKPSKMRYQPGKDRARRHRKK
jgi:hypothetical protein